MRDYLTNHLSIALFAISLAVVVFVSGWYVDQVHSDIESRIIHNIEVTNERLNELSVITDRNGADALTEKIISDCPRRGEFENLLNVLGTLSQKDLITMQQLFESCGSFYAERKALMVSHLEREFQDLESSLSLLGDIRDLEVEEVRLKDWGKLIELEKTRSSFLSEQTKIQEEIIALLLQKGAQTRINELVRQAQNIAESLSVTDAQIDQIRLSLL